MLGTKKPAHGARALALTQYWVRSAEYPDGACHKGDQGNDERQAVADELVREVHMDSEIVHAVVDTVQRMPYAAGDGQEADEGAESAVDKPGECGVDGPELGGELLCSADAGDEE